MTVSGLDANRVSEVSAGTAVLLAGLTITRGRGLSGAGEGQPLEDAGGVLNFGRLALVGCVVSDSYARIGGGVLNAAGATLDARNCLFSGNRSDIASAVFNNERGVMTLTDCPLTGNLGGPAVPSGLTLRNAGTAALVRTVIDGNAGGFQNNGSMTVTGGSVYANAGDASYNYGDLALTDVLVAANARGIYNGGALGVVRGRVAENGTGLDNFGSADLAGCVVYGNAAGGVFTAAGATLAMAESVVSANRFHRGGGLYVRGTATLTDCLIASNGASRDDGFPARGGGAYVEAGGRAAFADCVIAGNAATGDGGGVYNSAGGNLSLVGCTVSNNAAGVAGGGVFVGDRGSESARTSAVISHSTLTGNTAATGGGALSESVLEVYDSTVSGNYASGLGGGIRTAAVGLSVLRSATVFGNRAGQSGGGLEGPGQLADTLVAGNRRGPAGTEGTPDDVAAGDVLSGSSNLVGDAATSGGFVNGSLGNVVGVDWRAVLDPVLRHNGGPTPTHALIPGSVAIDAGAASPLATDQRGVEFPRQVGAAVDIGAYEYGAGVSAASAAGAPHVRTDDEPLAEFWSRAAEDEGFAASLTAV